MNFWVFPIAIIAIVLAFMLRTPNRSGPIKAIAFFLIGFAVSAAAIRMTATTANIGRGTLYDNFIIHALNQANEDPDAPIALFVDGSMSRNGLDDAYLTQRLRDMGYPHRAINLSLEGASLQERQQNLTQYINALGRVPDVIFLGVAPEFDRRAAHVFNIAKFSNRAFDQFTPAMSTWVARGISTGSCFGLKGCVLDAGLAGAHVTMNASNVGLLSTGQVLHEMPAMASWSPKHEPLPSFKLTDEQIHQGLTAPIKIEPLHGAPWASAYRAEQRDILTGMGVRRLAYYMPPVIPPDIREYTASVCVGELSDYPCIAPVDPELLAKLDGPLWLDEKHMLVPAAHAYADWLAEQIDAWGALK